MKGTLQRWMWVLVLPATLLITRGTEATAQERTDPGTGVIRGVAFDSTTMTPLAGAAVSVAGGGGELRADADGTFRFEDVPPGDYPIILILLNIWSFFV